MEADHYSDSATQVSNFTYVRAACSIFTDVQDQRYVLPGQLDFQDLHLDLNQLGLDNDVQFQAPALDSFTPNFVNTENHTTGSQNDIPQISAPPLDSLNLNFVNNLSAGPQFQAPFESISDMPLILPPPSTPPRTPHATDVRLPAVPDEGTGPVGLDLEVVVPSPPNHRQRTRTTRAAVVSKDAQQIPPPEETCQRRARNVAFNRRELDNAIGTSSARRNKRGHDNDIGSNKYVCSLISFVFFTHRSFSYRRHKRG